MQISQKFWMCIRQREINDLVWRDEAPYDQIIRQLWGCDAVCPFCHEPCQKQENHQDKHHCIQHRPCGVHGTRDKHSQELVPDTCSFLVTTSRGFECSACDNVCRKTKHCNATDSDTCHSYRDYHQYMPDWDIAPDNAGEASQYWQWFMARYNIRMAEHYHCQPANIPTSWTHVSQERALNSLREYHS